MSHSLNCPPPSSHIFNFFACLPLGTLLSINQSTVNINQSQNMQTIKPLSKTAIEALSRALVGGYSNTSKMPCRAWSIPASTCHTGSRLAQIKGTVCEDCYALKGFYSIPSNQTTLHKRLATAADLEQWTRNHIKLIPLVETSGYFRWFDSGDLQSIAMLAAIATIARALPGIKFWLPTKEHAFVAAWIRQGNVVPSNLIIRLSAYKLGAKAPAIATKLGVHASTVNATTGLQCNAPKQDNACLDCRACWSKAVPSINYTKH
jgi:hypothetical protein